jgi:hypothetical protein
VTEFRSSHCLVLHVKFCLLSILGGRFVLMFWLAGSELSITDRTWRGQCIMAAVSFFQLY